MVVALLWNPSVPSGEAAGSDPRWVVLDGSRSMEAEAQTGQGALWDLAVARATELAAQGYRILLVEDQPRVVTAEALTGRRPGGSVSAMTEALTVVAEAGGQDVRLLTDRRISDPLGVSDAGRRLGLSVQIEELPEAAPNLGLDALAIPPAVESGGEAVVAFDVRGEAVSDSVTVSLTLDGLEVAREVVTAPQGGGVTRVEMEVRIPRGSGNRRLVVALEDKDGFPYDDQRVGLLRVDPEETGVFVVGFRPDWEPRYLFPLLREVTGLPSQGFLRIGPDRFAPLDGVNRESIDAEGIYRRIERAQLVVLTGVDESVGRALGPRLGRVGRLLLIPADPSGAALVGLNAAPASGGEWYIGPVPPSPIAGGISGLVGEDLPPIGSLMRLREPSGVVGLTVQTQGAGQPAPALVLQTRGNARTVTALARGTWRWASRGGPAEEDYRRLWSSVAGWLLADAPSGSGLGVRPVESIQQLGPAQSWFARGHEGDSLTITVRDGSGGVVVDTVLMVSEAGAFQLAPLPVGEYTYTASATAEAAPLTGRFEVEGFTDEMLKRPVDEARLRVVGSGSRGSTSGRRPFRTSPLPYLLILAILCMEWAGRRRLGLR